MFIFGDFANKLNSENIILMSEKQHRPPQHHEILLVDTPLNTSFKYQGDLNLDIQEHFAKNESAFNLPKINKGVK
mgnify:CR=1 FL=1